MMRQLSEHWTAEMESGLSFASALHYGLRARIPAADVAELLEALQESDVVFRRRVEADPAPSVAALANAGAYEDGE